MVNSFNKSVTYRHVLFEIEISVKRHNKINCGQYEIENRIEPINLIISQIRVPTESKKIDSKSIVKVDVSDPT